jgi:hypothetical protein
LGEPSEFGLKEVQLKRKEQKKALAERKQRSRRGGIFGKEENE